MPKLRQRPRPLARAGRQSSHVRVGIEITPRILHQSQHPDGGVGRTAMEQGQKLSLGSIPDRPLSLPEVVVRSSRRSAGWRPPSRSECRERWAATSRRRWYVGLADPCLIPQDTSAAHAELSAWELRLPSALSWGLKFRDPQVPHSYSFYT